MNQNDFAKAMTIVKHKVNKMSTITTSAASLSSTSHTTLSKKDAVKQQMNRLAGIDTNQPDVRPTSADVEISLFTNSIKTKQSFKEFWSTHRHSFPRLVTLVNRYCIVPATSVASESAFSISGFIARKQRSSLSSRTLRHLLVLKYRKNLLKFQSNDQPSLFQDRQFQSLSLDTARSTSV
jgi:hypothetical protein